MISATACYEQNFLTLMVTFNYFTSTLAKWQVYNVFISNARII